MSRRDCGRTQSVTNVITNNNQFPVKLENGKMLLFKEENMIREGTRGAEGKNKGIERVNVMVEQ